jgi:hypothetical protein
LLLNCREQAIDLETATRVFVGLYGLSTTGSRVERRVGRSSDWSERLCWFLSPAPFGTRTVVKNEIMNIKNLLD